MAVRIMVKVYTSTFEDVLASLAVPGIPVDGQEPTTIQQLLQLSLINVITIIKKTLS